MLLEKMYKEAWERDCLMVKEAAATLEDVQNNINELVAQREELARQQALADEYGQQVDSASEAFKAYPNATGARIGALAGSTAAGAGIGAGIGRLAGRDPRSGALIGAGAGLLGGVGAQVPITNHLNKKHPGRAEAFDEYQGALDRLYRQHDEVEDQRDLADLVAREAAQIGHEYPGLYAQAVRGAGASYPKGEVQREIANLRAQQEKLKRQEAEMAELALNERRVGLQNASRQGALTDEEIIKQRYKNERRMSGE